MAAGLSRLLGGARSPPALGMAIPASRVRGAPRRPGVHARGEGASGWARRLEREVKSRQAWNRQAATGFGWDFHSPGAQQHPAGRAEVVLGLLRHCPGAKPSSGDAAGKEGDTAGGLGGPRRRAAPALWGMGC